MTLSAQRHADAEPVTTAPPPGTAPGARPAGAPVPFATRLGWGIGSLGAAILFNSYAVLLLFYLTNVVGMKV